MDLSPSAVLQRDRLERGQRGSDAHLEGRVRADRLPTHPAFELFITSADESDDERFRNRLGTGWVFKLLSKCAVDCRMSLGSRLESFRTGETKLLRVVGDLS